MLETHPLNGNTHYDWIDVEAPTDEEIQQLAQTYNLPTLYLQDVMQPEHLPKWEYAEDSQLYFLIGRYYSPEGRGHNKVQDFTRKLAIFYYKGRVITIHRAQVPFLDDLKQACKVAGNRYQTPFLLLCKILKEIFRSYEDIIQKHNDELEFYEDKILSKTQLPPFIRGLFVLKRQVGLTRKIIIMSKNLLDALTEFDQDSARVQDTRDMHLRVENQLDDLNERVNHIISIHLALQDQRSNEVMRVLTIFSAFFLPITAIAGIYGMNFLYMPELQHPYGYFACLGLMATVSLAIFFWFKRKGWM